MSGATGKKNGRSNGRKAKNDHGSSNGGDVETDSLHAIHFNSMTNVHRPPEQSPSVTPDTGLSCPPATLNRMKACNSAHP